jgi:preprotein translocase SecE subunit
MSRRDRQRRRRAANPGPRPSEPHRDNVPGSLDHASGEVDEFEAAIVAGAEGQPVVEDDPAKEFDTISEEEFQEIEDEQDEILATSGDSTVAAGGKTRPPRSKRPTAHEPAAHAGGNRLIGFLRACWAELQRVQWPDRRQVGQATAVVIGFVIIAGAYLGLADVVAQRVIDFIL